MTEAHAHPDDACERLLLALLHDERALYAAVAPDGLDRSPLRSFAGSSGSERHRWLHVLGTVLWEVFSSNHEVRSTDGRLYDLGSWRGTGSFIADLLNRLYPDDLDYALDYLDFYCGFAFFTRPDETNPDAADEPLHPLFGYVFERLRTHGCTWTYAPPALGLVRLAPPETSDHPAHYDPTETVRQELEEQEREDRLRSLEEELAEMNARARKQAVERPPLPVRVYREVYGHWPRYLDSGQAP